MFKRHELLKGKIPIVVSFRPQILDTLNNEKTPVPSGEMMAVSQMALLGMLMLDPDATAGNHEAVRLQAGELRKFFERCNMDPAAFTQRLLQFIAQGNDLVAKMTGVTPQKESFFVEEQKS